MYFLLPVKGCALSEIHDPKKSLVTWVNEQLILFQCKDGFELDKSHPEEVVNITCDLSTDKWSDHPKCEGMHATFSMWDSGC